MLSAIAAMWQRLDPFNGRGSSTSRSRVVVVAEVDDGDGVVNTVYGSRSDEGSPATCMIGAQAGDVLPRRSPLPEVRALRPELACACPTPLLSRNP